jgi:hypothetical protein
MSLNLKGFAAIAKQRKLSKIGEPIFLGTGFRESFSYVMKGVWESVAEHYEIEQDLGAERHWVLTDASHLEDEMGAANVVYEDPFGEPDVLLRAQLRPAVARLLGGKKADLFLRLQNDCVIQVLILPGVGFADEQA